MINDHARSLAATLCGVRAQTHTRSHADNDPTRQKNEREREQKKKMEKYGEK